MRPPELVDVQLIRLRACLSDRTCPGVESAPSLSRSRAAAAGGGHGRYGCRPLPAGAACLQPHPTARSSVRPEISTMNRPLPASSETATGNPSSRSLALPLPQAACGWRPVSPEQQVLRLSSALDEAPQLIGVARTGRRDHHAALLPEHSGNAHVLKLAKALDPIQKSRVAGAHCCGPGPLRTGRAALTASSSGKPRRAVQAREDAGS